MGVQPSTVIRERGFGLSKDEVFERVKVRLGEILRDIPAERLTPEVSLTEGLGMDSMFMLESTMALEEEFDSEMMDADLPRLKTLGDLTDYVVERMAA